MHINGLFTKKIGTHLAIDQVAYSRRTVHYCHHRLKARKVLSGNCCYTKTEQVIEHVSKIDSKKRQAVNRNHIRYG
jgi:hypothetical protein